MSPQELLTVEEVATFLRVAPNTVYRWCRNGKLTGIKIGKEWRIARADLDYFLAGRSNRSQNGSSLEQLLRRQLAPPEHVLVMASTPDEVFRLQAEFLQVGLKAGYPLFIGGWWQGLDEIRSCLTAHGLGVSELEASGRLVIADLAAAHAGDGARGVIRVWEEQSERVTAGQVLWGTGSHRLSDWGGMGQELIQFEDQLHRAFQSMPVIALCPCMLDSVNQGSFDVLLHLATHHSGALFTSGNTPVLMKTTD